MGVILLVCRNLPTDHPLATKAVLGGCVSLWSWETSIENVSRRSLLLLVQAKDLPFPLKVFNLLPQTDPTTLLELLLVEFHEISSAFLCVYLTIFMPDKKLAHTKIVHRYIA